MSPAVLLGQFLGAVLTEMAPVIVVLWQEMNRATAEKGDPLPGLRDRLRERIARLKEGMKQENGTRKEQRDEQAERTGTAP